MLSAYREDCMWGRFDGAGVSQCWAGKDEALFEQARVELP